MKKSVMFLLICTMLASCLSVWISAAEPVDGFPIAEAAKGTPVIDGEIDEIWATTTEYTVAHFIVQGTGAEPATVTFRILWDETYLYFLYVVDDPTMGSPAYEETSLASNIWKRDSLAFSFDPEYNRSNASSIAAPSFVFMIGAFGNTANFQNVPGNVFIGDVDEDGKVYTDENGKPIHTNFAISYRMDPNDDEIYIGYTMELKVNLKPRYDAIEMKEGTCIGFETLYNDNFATEASSTRDCQIEWGSTNGASYYNNSQKGTILLKNEVETPTPLPDPDDPTPPVTSGSDEVTNEPPTPTQETPTKETPAPTSEEPTGEADSEPGTTAPAAPQDDGCKSVLASSALLAVLVVSAGAAVVVKKKEN